jgi:DNA invertase Pin-like site-specific DNA recombinase
MPTAYSYARFSSEKQKHGASLDRQLEAATRYAHTHSLVLDPSSYRDLGVSAFRSKNVDGALGAFIEAVDAKRIPKGSYLLIESFDRLSRDSVDVALELVLSILRKGIVIVTLFDEQVYSSAIIKENWTKIIVMLAIQARANEESVTKSKRAHDAIVRRVDRGEIPTTRLPTWLKFTPDRKKATFVSERAAIIKRIFDMAIKGVGARGIARTFNDEKVPVLFYAKEWRQSCISTVLRNPAAYGSFKGKDNVLPAVVTKEKFSRAQVVIDARKLFKGIATSANPNNIFAGLSRCGHCGRVMRFQPRRDRWYMKCVGNADNASCKARMFPFHACETALIYELAHRANRSVGADFFREQTNKREQLEQEVTVNKERQRKLIEVAALVEGVEVVAEELKRLQGHIDALEAELKTLSAFPLSQREMHENAALFGIYSRITDKELTDWNPYDDKTKDIVEFRQKLKVILVRTLKKIEFKNGRNGWSPTLVLTYVSGKQAVVDVTKYLPHRTLVQISHGIHHRSDLGKTRKSSRKKGA